MSQDLGFFRCIPMAVFNSATMSGTYQALNGTGFASAIKILKIYNGSTVAFTVSYGGVADEDFFPIGATQIIDLQTNHSDNSAYGSGLLNGRQGQKVYGKGTAGTGNIYIIGYY